MRIINSGNHSNHPVNSYLEILKEYFNLSQRPELSEIEGKRLEHILDAASSDDLLSLLLNEIDDAVFNAQDLSEHLNYHDIQNEVARVVELIGGQIPCHKNVFANAKLNLAAYEPILKEYSQLLQVKALSDADAARMEQILDAAYEDDLLALLLDIANEDLVRERSNAITHRRLPTIIARIKPALIACSLLFTAASLAVNLLPITLSQEEKPASSDFASSDDVSVSKHVSVECSVILSDVDNNLGDWQSVCSEGQYTYTGSVSENVSQAPVNTIDQPRTTFSGSTSLSFNSALNTWIVSQSLLAVGPYISAETDEAEVAKNMFLKRMDAGLHNGTIDPSLVALLGFEPYMLGLLTKNETDSENIPPLSKHEDCWKAAIPSTGSNACKEGDHLF